MCNFYNHTGRDLQESYSVEEIKNTNLEMGAQESVDDDRAFGADAPSRTSGWNWSAFSFPVMCGLLNNVYWPLLVSVVLPVILYLISPIASNVNNPIFLFGFLFLVRLLMMLYMGAEGNRMSRGKARIYTAREVFEQDKYNFFPNIAGMFSLRVAAVSC